MSKLVEIIECDLCKENHDVDDVNICKQCQRNAASFGITKRDKDELLRVLKAIKKIAEEAIKECE